MAYKSSPALQQLRKDTATLHSGIEKTVELDTLIQIPVNLSRYVCLLRTHLQLHLDLAQILVQSNADTLVANWSNTEQIKTLRADLKQLRCLEDKQVSAKLPKQTAPSALGWIYVVEGASHGNLQMLNAFKKDEKFSTMNCTSYFALGAERLHHHWPLVLTALAALDPREIDCTVRGAIACFEHFAKIWADTLSAKRQVTLPADSRGSSELNTAMISSFTSHTDS